MLFPLTDMTHYSTKIGDDALKISDILFDERDWQLKFLILDTSGWFDNQQTLVSSDLITGVDSSNRDITLSLDKADLEGAPRFMDGEGSPGIWANLPPVFVGPFGNPVSPLMTTAALTDGSGTPKGTPRAVAQFERFSDWKNLEVFGKEGQLGTLDDLLYDHGKRAVTHMVVDNSARLSGRQLVLPIEVFRHFAAQETHIVVALSENQLDDAPQIETLDKVDRHWLDTLRTYYALPI